ncbi:MAG: FecR domain-containing protein [Spirochaetes bacterium]|nr:FecR domain-containing protein [Spirochaetota bacterium]
MRRIPLHSRILPAFVVMLLCVSVGLSSCSKKEGPPLAAVIVFLAGDVKVGTASTSPRNAELGERISEGDVITTGEKSHATIQIGDRGVTRVERNSRVEIKKLFAAGDGEVFLHRGEVAAKIARLQRSESFMVKSPTAIAAVRGTEFIASYKNGSGKVAVRQGKVAVTAMDEGKETPAGETMVEEGRTAVVKVDEAAPAEKVTVELRPITELETMKIERAAAITIIPDIEKVRVEDLVIASAPAVEKEKALEVKIEVEEKKVEAVEKAERMEQLIQKQSATMEEIKEAFDRIDEISLYNGKVLRGAIIERGKQYSILTTNGTVQVPEAQVRSVRVIR